MSDRLGLYEMLFILGIGVLLIGFELYSLRGGNSKKQDRDEPPASSSSSEPSASSTDDEAGTK